MGVGGRDPSVPPQKGSDDTVSYPAQKMSSDWQVNGNNLTNTSIGMIPMGNSVVETPACSSACMVDSFCPPVWDPSIGGQSLGYVDVNCRTDASTSSSLGPVRADVGWTPNAMLKGSMFLPTLQGVLPQSLPHFPDSAFIERAARFSCFNGGNLGEMMNPFSIHDPLNPYSRGFGLMQGPQEVVGGSMSKPLVGMQLQRHEMNVTEVSKDASLPGKHETEGSLFKKDKRSESFMCSHEEAKRGVGPSGNEPDEAEFSGGQEELGGAAGESSGKGLSSKKRKRAGQGIDNDENNETPQPSIETVKESVEIKHKGDQNPTSINKSSGKTGKQGSQGSDTPKEEYIHIRARRGQATNSHSLAERVRREKISERMKFLQDLVPGCSKVTGKAVMLDEIINYVQSLQRQVEFLSMKLATVNPCLDFNIEGFLAKDILQPRAGMSSSLAFPPDVTQPFRPLHPPQPGLIQACLPGNSSETFGRPINLQSPVVCAGFKEPTSQVPVVWDDELHNVVHMGFKSSAPLNSQDLNGSLPPRRMKAEP